MEESKYFPLWSVLGVSKSTCFLNYKKKKKKKGHNEGIIKYFISPFTSTRSEVCQSHNLAMLQSSTAAHNPWAVLLCELPCLFFFSQGSLVEKQCLQYFFLLFWLLLKPPSHPTVAQGGEKHHASLLTILCVFLYIHHPTRLWKYAYVLLHV